MSNKWFTGMPVYHHRRRCYGFLLYEVTSDSDEYQRGATKSGTQWKVLWTIHEDTSRHSEKTSVHQQRNLAPSTFTKNMEIK